MKIVRLPQSDPKNFGPKKVQSKRYRELEKHGQLNLFTSGKILPIQSMSAFDEGLMLDERGDRARAKKMYLKAVQEEESVADAYCNLGIIAFEEQKYAESVDYLGLSLICNPRHYQAHFNLANVYAEIGDNKLAKAHYQICTKIRPDFASPYFNLGLTLVSLKEYSAALDVLYNYLDLTDPDEQQPARSLIQKIELLDDTRD